MHQNVLVQLFNLGFDPVPDREIIVHHQIQQVVEELIRRVDLLLHHNGLDGADFPQLLAGGGNDIMLPQENVHLPQENLLIVKPDAVHNNKIMGVENFQLRTLFFFVQAVLNGQIMQLKQRLEGYQILHFRVDPIKSAFRRENRFCYIINDCKNSVLYQAHFHGHPSSC
ncbi:hypothetical protein D3C80_1531490 [compost metagenome]